jgi:hypothetical protein
MQSNNFPHHRIEVGCKSNKLPNALISLPLPQRAKKYSKKLYGCFMHLTKTIISRSLSLGQFIRQVVQFMEKKMLK